MVFLQPSSDDEAEYEASIDECFQCIHDYKAMCNDMALSQDSLLYQKAKALAVFDKPNIGHAYTVYTEACEHLATCLLEENEDLTPDMLPPQEELALVLFQEWLAYKQGPFFPLDGFLLKTCKANYGFYTPELIASVAQSAAMVLAEYFISKEAEDEVL